MVITASSLTLSPPIPRPAVDLPLPSSALSFLAANSGSTTLFKKAGMGITANRIGTPRTKQFGNKGKGLTCNALFGLGVPELVVIAGVAALVFGPKKLPEVGRSIGKTVKSFQQAAKEFESELKKEPKSIEEAPAEKPAAVSEQEKQDIKVSSSKDSV